jgi:eukaryotic-like serine/threonine-protein kinase
MAEVFLAVARGPAGFNKLTVIKQLRNAEDASLVRMFLDEARLSARLSHPNIVHTYEVGDANQRFFIAMEYLEGQSLDSLLTWLNGRGPGSAEPEPDGASGERAVTSPPEGLSETIATFIAAQVARGLHYAHELTDYDGTALGVVHRDVSPHNVFITYRGEVKLLDFGIAKASMNVTETETGVVKGKIRYMSPEQITGNEIDRRADVFALGIVLWEMLARRKLFEGDSVSVLKRIVRSDVVSVRSIRPEVAPELDAIVLKALRRDRSERYATAEEMGIALERFLQSRSDPGMEGAITRLMTEGFAATRENVRSRIKAFLAMVPSSDAESPAGSELGEIGDQLPKLHGDGSGPKTTLEAPISTLLSPKGLSTPPRASAKSVPWVPLTLAVLVAGFGAIGLRMIGSKDWRAAPAAVAAPSTSAHIHLSTIPPVATVEVDGAPLGTTPADFALAPGARVVRLSRDGYEDETIALDVQPGASIDRALVLRAKVAPLAASSPPPASSLPSAPSPSIASPPPLASVGASSAASPPRRPKPVVTTAPSSSAPPPSSTAPVRSKIRVIDDSDPQ